MQRHDGRPLDREILSAALLMVGATNKIMLIVSRKDCNRYHPTKLVTPSTTMTVTPLFNPPAPDSFSKPYVEPWIPPSPTKDVDNFAELETIDLGLLDSSDPNVVSDLIAQVKRAIREDGFLFLENYGVSLEQVCTKSWQSRS